VSLLKFDVKYILSYSTPWWGGEYAVWCRLAASVRCHVTIQLLCVTVYCSVLQCVLHMRWGAVCVVHRSMMSFGCSSTKPCDYSVAVCCSVLQCVLHIAVWCHSAALVRCRGTIQLQCVAVCCSVLQCVLHMRWGAVCVVHRSMMSFGCSCTIPRDYSVAVCCSMLQCVAVCVAHRSMISFGCSSTMPYDCSYQKMMCCKYREVEVCWTAVATYCNTLQHTATHCNSLQLTATHCNSLQL